MAVGEGAARHQRGDDRDAGELGEHPQLGGRAGLEHAAADVEHRALGLGDQPGGLADLLGVRAGRRVVAGQVEHGRPGERRRSACRMSLGMSTSTGPGRPVRAMWNASAMVRGMSSTRLHQEVVLGDRHRDAADVGLLEGVGADRGARHLAGDGDDRHRVHVGVGDRRDEVGRARARWSPCRRRPCRSPARSPRRRGRRPARGAPGCGGASCESKSGSYAGQDRAAGDAEDDLDADALEAAHERLGSGEGSRGRVGHGGSCRCVRWRGNKKPLVPGARGVSATAAGRSRASELREWWRTRDSLPPVGSAVKPCGTSVPHRGTRVDQPVTAPWAAEPTSLAYLPSTPVV